MPKNKRPTAVLIGAGNVAYHLGVLLASKGYHIIQVYSRTKSGQALAAKLRSIHIRSVSDLRQDADVYLVAVSDKAISGVIKKMNFDPGLIVHTSGSTPINVFPEWMTSFGVLYPLQSFSKKVKRKASEIPFLIEGNSKKSVKRIRRLAGTLSNSVLEMNSDKRSLVHLAAVLVNNFSNHLATLAGEILHQKKIDPKILRPLLFETVMRVIETDPKKAQSGPAIRGDDVIIRKHLSMLKKFPEIQTLYSLFSKSIRKTYHLKK